jgi:hypothetical protein
MHALCESGHFVKFVAQLVLTIVNPHCRSLLTCRFTAVYTIKNPKQPGLHSIRRNGIVKGKPETLKGCSSNGIESLRWFFEVPQIGVFIRFGVYSRKPPRVCLKLGFPLTITFRLMECRPRCFGFLRGSHNKAASQQATSALVCLGQSTWQTNMKRFLFGRSCRECSICRNRAIFFQAGCRHDGIVPS